MSNTVNSNNFNETLDGYVKYAIDFTEKGLKEIGYSKEQIEQISEYFEEGIRWGKSEMTLENARNYKSEK
jgi:hypothetical protein